MNRKFKDSLFVALFSDEALLRDLYNALAGTHYGDDVDVSINTLENVLFMERRNDISFTLGGKIVVLIEHQSTINLNMPLRFLLYIARVLEVLLGGQAIYREALIPLLIPDFYVVYNGARDQPDYQELRLSDAFRAAGLEAPFNLELIVKVININHGHSPEILSRCKPLREYAEFVAMVRKEQRPNMSREEGKQILRKVINRSIGKGILKDFLEKHASEVRNMLDTKWNWNDYFAVKEEELRDELEAKYQAKYQAQIQQVLDQNRRLEEENRRLRGN
jgi:hypothetical protein